MKFNYNLSKFIYENNFLSHLIWSRNFKLKYYLNEIRF